MVHTNEEGEMAQDKVIQLPVFSTDHDVFCEIGHMVKLPCVDMSEEIQFFPAIDGFETGSVGSERIDLSYLYVPYHRNPLNSFDKHPNNEELFLALQGSFYMIAGLSSHGEMPDASEMRCFQINEGDIFIQKKNVWHTACWPLDPKTPVKYIMVLSGHRNADAEGSKKVDHHIRELPNGLSVIPNFS